jgi:hypothetical protein
VTRNYNTKPNEKAHRPFKKFYLLDTNFKDTDPQVIVPDLTFFPGIYHDGVDLET